MQDVQPINGVVSGRVLLKRLTHHQQFQQQQQQQHQQQAHLLLHHQQQPQQHHQQQQQALKCPRCDSLNTKFCYYNNYNLSQPRHFCKNCRRYWTKGGVLRNVPVGGGCRKSKRSSSSSSSSTKHKSSSSSSNTSANSSNSPSSEKINNNAQNSTNNSSSESSSTNAAVGGRLFQIPEVENFGISSDLEPLVDSTTSNLFSGEIGGFFNLISDNNNNNTKNNDNFSVVVDDGNANVSAAAAASFTEFLQNQGVQEWDMGKISGVHQEEEEKIGGTSIDLVDPTVRIEDFLQNRGTTVGITSLDWHLTAGNNIQSLFDVPDNSTTVDHQAYWNQSTSATHHHHDSQWSDSTTSHLPLFLP